MSGNVAFGRFDDSFSAASLKAYVAEFISTLVFVFAGVGSAIAYSESITQCLLLQSFVHSWTRTHTCNVFNY